MKQDSWSVASGYFAPDRALGVSPLFPAACIMAHEIAHALGAQHDTSLFSIMNSGLNHVSRFTKRQCFTQKTKIEIEACLASEGGE